MIQQLIAWNKITNELAEYFIIKYFGKLEDCEYWWIADDIGDVIFINDYFFNLSDIVDFLKYKYSKKDMFTYYDYRLAMDTKDKNPICIRDWKKLKK